MHDCRVGRRSRTAVHATPPCPQWRNRCIQNNSFPLPLATAAVTEPYNMKHGLATLLAVPNVKDIVVSFERAVPLAPPLDQLFAQVPE